MTKEYQHIAGGSIDDIRQEVLQYLQKFSEDEDGLIEELCRLSKKNGDQIYAVALHLLTHLELGEEEARECWEKIIAHRDMMTSSMGRKIGLRTAICSYFCDVKKSLKNPKIVEIHIFEDTVRSSKYDNLTKLINRRYLDEALLAEFTRSKRHGLELSILFFDLDNFKRLNDTFGHSAGDAVLFRVAQIILDLKRTEDIAARYGGEEMVLLLPETNNYKALILGERIRKAVENMEINHDGKTLTLTLSGGISTFPTDGQTPGDLLNCADKALYRAKAAGKNNIALCSRDKRHSIRLDFSWETLVQKKGETFPLNFVTRGKNLSMTGILFESKVSFERGNKLKLQFRMEQNSKPLLVSGTVMRIELLDTSLYDIGVSFLEMDKSVKNEISDYIVHYLESPQT